MTTDTFTPTHVISETRADGRVVETHVLLVDGAAYTQSEWDANAAADWSRDKHGHWLFQGQACPDGTTSVRVRSLGGVQLSYVARYVDSFGNECLLEGETLSDLSADLAEAESRERWKRSWRARKTSRASAG